MSGETRLVIFDVDGTLVDSQAHIHASLVAAHAAIGRDPVERAELLSVVGLSLPIALGQLQPDLPEGDLDLMIAAYRDSYQAQRASGVAALFAGIAPLLDDLAGRDDTLLGVATGATRRGLAVILEQHDLKRHFVTVQTADDHPSKPDPSMLCQAVAEAGVDATQAMMIGDTTYDIEMARSAGIRAIGVAWGHHRPDRLRDAGAETICETVRDLSELLLPVREVLDG